MLEILTPQHLNDVLQEMILIKAELKGLRQVVQEIRPPQKILKGPEIRERLGGISDSTFIRLREDLCAAGMYKMGNWKITEENLMKYIENKKNN